MSALPADIARYTTDGVVLTAFSQSIKNTHADAQTTGDEPVNTFFDTVAAAQTILNERFAWLSMIGRPHEALEVEEDLGLGTTVPLMPQIPLFQLNDDDRFGIATTGLRSYSFDMTTDRYAIELVGMPKPIPGSPTQDTTAITADTTAYTSDDR